MMFGIGMFLIGLLSATPIILYVLMSVDSLVSDRTIELETENDELLAIRYDRADKINELEKELAKLSIEKDRLEIKYKKLLEEK